MQKKCISIIHTKLYKDGRSVTNMYLTDAVISVVCSILHLVKLYVQKQEIVCIRVFLHNGSLCNLLNSSIDTLLVFVR